MCEGRRMFSLIQWGFWYQNQHLCREGTSTHGSSLRHSRYFKYRVFNQEIWLNKQWKKTRWRGCVPANISSSRVEEAKGVTPRCVLHRICIQISHFPPLCCSLTAASWAVLGLSVPCALTRLTQLVLLEELRRLTNYPLQIPFAKNCL